MLNTLDKTKFPIEPNPIQIGKHIRLDKDPYFHLLEGQKMTLLQIITCIILA